MDTTLLSLLTELVEKTGLLRRDLQHRGALEQYAARVDRIEQKISLLADHISEKNPKIAEDLRTAWRLPGRSLAFRNVEHRNASLQQKPDGTQD